MQNFNPDCATRSASTDLAAQQSRERNAREVLQNVARAGANAVGLLNLYCKKTKVELHEELNLVGSEFTCVLKYESILRSVQATGSSGPFSRAADGKKQAKRNAAAALLETLWQDS